ncbi:PAS domain-containing protein [Sphingobacterium pedocola]|uniref:histidine kinase n=1 Tax=Sphingobacterium pedocola TaxID=2082722 RepID=A0ABR9TCA7_9SPHI|nr:PAS domain-containing protein [Sphingobacterium pedocola]MBE8723002.1 hypothetical protein [Sphingobacterium pedocola]
MDHITAPIFQALFQSESPRIILKADAPEFTILDYNIAHQSITGRTKINYRGESIWKAYDPAMAGGEGPELLAAALEQALAENSLIKMPVFRYDILSDETGTVVQHWWQLEILPVAKEGNRATYLLVTTHDVTNEMMSERREQELNEELAATNEELAASNEELAATLEDLQVSHTRLENFSRQLEERVAHGIQAIANSERSLRSLVMAAHYPLMILRGRDWIIEIANQPLVNLWDRTIEEVTGHKLMDILPEIESQPFPMFLRQVYDSGVGYGQEEQIFHYNSPKGPATKYVSFYYDPLCDDKGDVVGIIVAADDITTKVHQRQMLQEALAKEQSLTEEMSSLNEELAATVEELSAANEDLVVSQEEIRRKNDDLIESEARFRLLIKQAPVGICVIRSHDLYVLEVNDNYLNLVGKERAELEGRAIWEGVTEAAEDYAPVLSQVIQTGVPFVATEHQVTLIRYGKPEDVFIDFVYEPVLKADGHVMAILVVAIDVTEKVKARKAIEEAGERTRLAVESADIGTFEYSYSTNAIITSERFNEIFEASDPISRLELLDTFHPDDVHLSAKAHAAAAIKGKMMYEARILHKDKSIHWIRVQAKVFYGTDGIPDKLMGTVLDITDFKRLQQQKDDFISIASHELKTPITSLKASLQFLQRIKDTPGHELFPRLLTQAERSMEKVSTLIEDLLNVSNMDKDATVLNKTTFIVKDLLDDCCGHIRETGKHKLVFEGDPSLQVHADQRRIDQVVVNFVNNAVKYAPKSSDIYLRAEQIDGFVKISVRDTGPGIPPEKQKQIFERYFRVDSSGREVSGLGLGLYISADIVHRHDGEIGVHSDAGQGATFWFTLPL